MTLPRHIANQLGIVMDDKPKQDVSRETPHQVIEVTANEDGSQTVYYFGKTVGHIYKIGVKNRDGMQYRAISNYDDVRHFYTVQSATQFLMSSHH
jgi:hypothetical protein